MTKGLSALYWALLHMIDAGQAVTIDETYAHIEAGDTVAWLTRLAGEWEVETGMLALIRGSSEISVEIADFLERHGNAVSPSDVAVASNGLCLLLGFCLNELQAAFK